MQQARRLAMLRTELVLLIGAVVIVGLVLAFQLLAEDTLDRYRQVAAEVSHIKQAVTAAHLGAEEAQIEDLGDAGVALATEPLLDAIEDCRFLLDGGVTEVGVLRPMTDTVSRARVAELCTAVGALPAIVQASVAASALDEAYEDHELDNAFGSAVALAAQAQLAVDVALDADKQRLSLISLAICGVAIGLFTGLILLVRRYRRSTEARNVEQQRAGDEARVLAADAQHSAERSAVLNRLADRVTFANGEQDLVSAATAAIHRLVDSDAGDVLLLNLSQDRLMVAATWGETAHRIGAPAAVDTPSHCPGIRRGSPYVLEDATDDLSVGCQAHPISVGSSLCVPMLALGKSIGVLHLSRPDPGTFDHQSQLTAARVAEQVALGLANARLMQTMERLAMADQLTGLHNARFFDPLLDNELANAQRDGQELSVVMIDIDHFKRFNDAHGHPGGDEALKQFARTVKGAIRESDAVARYGGEEFAVLIRSADLAAATAVAEKIRSAIEHLIVDLGPNRTARITASLGVASTSAHGNDRMLLMRIADAALYRAKELGRNRVVAADASVASRSPSSRRPRNSGGAQDRRPAVSTNGATRPIGDVTIAG